MHSALGDQHLQLFLFPLQLAPGFLGHRRDVREVGLPPVGKVPRSPRQASPGAGLGQVPEQVSAGPGTGAPLEHPAGHLERMDQRVAGVAAEDLVGALPAQAHLDAAGGQPAHRVHREHRGADHGLVLLADQPRQVVGKMAGIVRGQLERKAQRSRRRFLKGPLVDHSRIREVHAEASRRLPRAGRRGGHGCGIDPPAEESAHRHVGHELVGNDPFQRFAHPQVNDGVEGLALYFLAGETGIVL